MQKVFLPLLFVLVLAHTCFAQQVAPGKAETTGAPAMIMRHVLPSDTDKAIDKWSDDGWMHYAYVDPSVPSRHQLLVFLAGTGGRGKGHMAFNKAAAQAGYHVVSPAYPSEVSISTFNRSEDPDVFIKARDNIIYGKVPFPGLEVNEPNAILNRLVKLLQYLSANYPQENWNQFITADGSLEWNKIVLAGQSQGGGHAALMAMQHPVERVLMFGSPKDFSRYFNKPAKWYSDPSATSLDRFFSFVHTDDDKNGCTYPEQIENYRAMKLIPTYKVINVDETMPPYEHSRLFTSTRPQINPHGAPLLDPSYRDVWKYMLTEPVQ